MVKNRHHTHTYAAGLACKSRDSTHLLISTQLTSEYRHMFPRDFVRTQQVSLLLFDMEEKGCSHFLCEAK